MKEPIFDIRRDIKRIAVIMAVIIIPLMYSYFYLNAFWDPYSKLDQLPVAVVNEDKGAVINEKDRNIGKEFVDELKENGKLKWVFTDKTEAQNGLKDRKYYAIVTVPENFSANIATAEKKEKVQGIIIYEPEQKRNYLASQILNKAMLELENKISSTITKEMVNYIADENKKLPDQLKELSEGLNTMQTDGTSKIVENLGTLKEGQTKFNDGIIKLNNALRKATSGTGSLYAGSSTLAAKQEEFYQALNKSVPQFKQMADGSILFQKNLVALDSGLLQINSGAARINSKLPELKAGIQKYNEGLKTYTQSLKAFGQGIAPLATQLQPLKAGSEQYYTNVSAYSAKMGELDKGVAQYVGSVKTLTATNKSVADMLTAYVKAHPEAMSDKNIQTIIATFQKSQDSLAQLNTASDSIQTNVVALSAGSQQLVSGSKQIKDGVTTFVNGAPQLSAGAAKLAAGTDTLVSGGEGLSTGLDSLSGGTSQMMAAIAQASGGATQLKDGYATLNAGIQKATGSIATAASSAGLLADATKKMNSGVSELKNSMVKMEDGSRELVSNGNKLLDGETKLKDGAEELDSKVGEAYTKVSDSQREAIDKVAKLDGLSDYVSDPVKIEEKDADVVHDYGTAFAPYFISLSLWVGALIMFVIIYLNPEMRFKRKLVKNVHMDVKFLIYPLIGIIQAVALALVLINGLNLQPTDTGMFYLVIILISLSFISIVQFLIVNLGDVGKFLVILLLILQLTASGGTFPNELVPKFFNDINGFMPMTYAIYALKESISGHNYGFLYQNMLVLAVIAVVFLLASLFLSGNKKAKSLDEIEEDYISHRKDTATEM